MGSRDVADRTMELLEQERGTADRCPIEPAGSTGDRPRSGVKHGMRNSNCMAIAPTATISTIIGVSQSIEPIVQAHVRQEQFLRRVHQRQRLRWSPN